MRYTVNLSPSAENDLIEVWLAAPDRRAVTQAARDLERELTVNAQDKGIDADGDRLIKVGPLVVFYAVYPDEGRVEVLQITHA